MNNLFLERDILQREGDHSAEDRTTDEGSDDIEGIFPSEEITHIIGNLDDRLLSNDDRERLFDSLRSLFLIEERERYILKAIRYYTDDETTDALEGLYLHLKKESIQLTCLEELDTVLRESREKALSCNFWKEITDT